jgi:ABC-type sugar transport system ATPase subunit
MARIVLDNVRFSYGVKGKAFSIEASLSVGHNEVVCLLGLSGSGKTSVLKLVAGLLAPHSGSIYINGSLASDSKHVKAPGERGMCVVFQTPSLLPYRTAIDNVLFAMHGKESATKKREAAAGFLSCMGVLNNAAQYPNELSLGQQQRVSIARAFASGADIMLLDEPFANLDVENRAQARECLSIMIRRYARSVILVTHDAEETMLLGDKVYVMDSGNVIQSGTPRELYYNPRNLFIARFFGQLNTIRARTDVYGNVMLPFTACLRCQFTSCNVVVGIRYEHIYLTEERDCTMAVVANIKFFGAYDIVQLMFCGGNIMSMRCPSGSCGASVGGVVRVKFKWDTAVVFQEDDEACKVCSHEAAVPEGVLV